MGYKELIASLQQEADEKVEAIWKSAQSDAERIREEAEKTLEQIRKNHETAEAKAKNEQTNTLLKDTEHKARTMTLSAEADLTRRLFGLAESCVKELRSNDCSRVFESLYRELPQAKWKEARVNPGDTGKAHGLFPDSKIIADSTISGGMEVVREDGNLIITNTFEKRLERAWEELLPLIMRDIYRTTDAD